MTDTAKAETPRPIGIFLSHAHEDRPFVRRLARDLTSVGVRVWVDEAEMRVGDPLEAKIAGAISELDYLGVVVSRHSARSEWVRREVEMALRGEIAGQRVKVLPLLLRGGQLPEALIGKNFADFTSELSYQSSLVRILDRLGVAQQPDESTDRLAELASASALLKGALLELRGEGISNATADALASSSVDDFDLSEFFTLNVRELEGQKLFGLALTILPCINKRAVGHEALDYCLMPGRLEEWQRAYVGMHMQDVTSPEAIRWCHSRLTTAIRSDPYYHSFLARHIEDILGGCYDEMASYLLQPNRGPDNYNIDSFEIIVDRATDPTPFRRRWLEWIRDGYFEPGKMGYETAERLYQVLNDHWGQAAFEDVTEAAHARVYFLLKSHSGREFRHGMYHLVAMIDAQYRGADRIIKGTISRVYDVQPDWRPLFEVLHAGLEAVVEYHQNPSPVQERRVRDCFVEAAQADRDGITGYFQGGPHEV